MFLLFPIRRTLGNILQRGAIKSWCESWNNFFTKSPYVHQLLRCFYNHSTVFTNYVRLLLRNQCHQFILHNIGSIFIKSVDFVFHSSSDIANEQSYQIQSALINILKFVDRFYWNFDILYDNNQPPNFSMASYQVLEGSRNILARLGLTKFHHANDPTNIFFTTILTHYSLLISFVFGFLSVVYLIIMNIDQTKFVLDAMMMTIGVPQFVGVYFSVWFNRDKVESLQLKLQEIIDKGIKMLTLSNI